MSTETYDIIIIGGGTSGLVLANRLSEDPNLQVIVLESGEDRSADPNTLTPGAWPLLSNSPADWTFHTVPQNDLGKHNTIPQGKPWEVRAQSIAFSSPPRPRRRWKDGIIWEIRAGTIRRTKRL
jgi:choline dehydrogenase-like flavoprotein